MKTVSGTVISSQPISLSKAAKTLSRFATADNGATPAVSQYLRRASDSFNELVRLHKELKGGGYERSSKKKHRSDSAGIVESVGFVENRDSDAVLEHSTETGIGGSDSKKNENKANADGGMGERILKNEEINRKVLLKKEAKDESKGTKYLVLKSAVPSSKGIPEENDVGADGGEKVNKAMKKNKKKKKKKQSDETEVNNSGNKVELQQKMESKKRKSEDMIHGVSDPSEQQNKFKRRKAKHEDN